MRLVVLATTTIINALTCFIGNAFMILTRIKTINALMTLIRLGISTLFALVVKIQAEIKRLARPIVANLTTITTSSRSYYAFTHVSISVHVKIILTHKAL